MNGSNANQLTYDLDFIYIDGDHRAPTVLSDAVQSFARLRHGGLMAFDDYYWGGNRAPVYCPAMGINAFTSTFIEHLTVIERGEQVWIRKTSDWR